MNVLLTGATGQLGRSLQACRPSHWTLHALSRAQLDITDRAAIAATMDALRPTLVINAAAYTAVDQAERDRDQAYAVNHQGAAYVAQAASDAGARLVHLSTDYVFDGLSAQPYAEDDVPHPINVYGASKRSGELAVLQDHPSACVVRTSGVFSEYGRNFLKTMLHLADRADAQPLRVVNDQRCCPTYAGDLAQAIVAMVEAQAAADIYHYCGATAVSWHAFAQRIFQQAWRQGGQRQGEGDYAGRTAPWPVGANRQGPPVVQAIASSDYPGAAPRPANSVLSCGKLQALGIEPRPLDDALARALHGIILSGFR